MQKAPNFFAGAAKGAPFHFDPFEIIANAHPVALGAKEIRVCPVSGDIIVGQVSIQSAPAIRHPQFVEDPAIQFRA